jgi:hypothetical protein
MRATGIFTESVYNDLMHLQVQNKVYNTPQAHIERVTTQLLWIILLFPVAFAILGPIVFSIGWGTAIAIAAIWFISFLLAGFLYLRSIIRNATKRPAVAHLDEPREYCIEGDWLVMRFPGSESRVSRSRAVGLVVGPTASYIDCGELGPFLLPFGSDSNDPDQRAFLDALQSCI